MPNLRVHEYASKLIFGRPYTEDHRYIDSPSQIYGSSHRKYRHDEKTAVYLASINNDWNRYWSHKLHCALDFSKSGKELEELIKTEYGRKIADKKIEAVWYQVNGRFNINHHYKPVDPYMDQRIIELVGSKLRNALSNNSSKILSDIYNRKRIKNIIEWPYHHLKLITER